MKRRLPAKYAPILYGFILSGLMSCIVSGITTGRVADIGPGFIQSWLAAWWPAWMVAFATLLVVAPMVRKIVALMTDDDYPVDTSKINSLSSASNNEDA